MPTGTVKWFNRAKGYGFIEPEDGDKDAFVHISAVHRAGMESLNEGQKLEYELVEGANGKVSAENLTDLGGGEGAAPAADDAGDDDGGDDDGGDDDGGDDAGDDAGGDDGEEDDAGGDDEKATTE